MSEPLSAGIHVMTESVADISAIIDGIVHVHASCILDDGTLATFLPPLSHFQLYQWWDQRVSEISRGERQIIVCLSNVKDRTTEKDVSAPWNDEGRTWPVIRSTSSSISQDSPTPGTANSTETELEVSGVVSLATPFSQTGPFRGLVEKLFVSPLHRRRGIAKQMMAKLESVAMGLGRWSLMLDTVVGSEAEHVYPRLGYEKVGFVKEYGYSPVDGRLVDEVWFWKDLRKMKRLEF
ncbi:uncharacterized protein Z519_08724 [Cladophialophora bantiana CBS 173.52]|uniref:N-acetyltransferase domain-containing protein n=1 Tax=Cladophialophora bantiana (strain ATCC 10958 / CBS 173.52 / CDC B-1940 / NIH 8579) TaxID=1442370 RepID=A0A0D2ELU0_CLAB1|nr:uncharacterized protein Z519_08724 [Cladophialophora bantiana CBS 173.52]KIW90941.1 hypothetical protein Z519_08724 [Cladophialophora bantiana CBS 173.52]